MKKKKSILLAILLMAVGFATVATNIFINGSTVIGTNTNEFEIIFTKALLDGENKTNEIISGDKKTITFDTNDLKDVGDKSILTYDVTNLSNQYDGNVTIDVDVETNDYIRVTNDFDTTNALSSRETRTGTLTVELIKAATTNLDFDIDVELVVSAVERSSVGTGDLPNDEVESLTFYDTNNQVLQNKNVTIDGTSYTTNNEGKVSNLSLNPYISHTLVIYPNNNEEYLSCSAPLFKDFDCDGLPIQTSLNSFYVPSANLEIGDILRIDTEDFYYIGNDASGNYKFLTKYNLNVGENILSAEYGEEGMQNSQAIGWEDYNAVSKFTEISRDSTGSYFWTRYSNDDYKYYTKEEFGNYSTPAYGGDFEDSDGNLAAPYVCIDERCTIKQYVDNYDTELKKLNNLVLSTRLITYHELIGLGFTEVYQQLSDEVNRDWLWSTSYWTGSAKDKSNMYAVFTNKYLTTCTPDYEHGGRLGVRPVVTISKSAVFTGEGTEESPYIITYRQ